MDGEDGAKTSVDLRAHNRVRLLRAVHDGAAARTRSRLTQELSLARGTASVLVTGLMADELLDEAPAPAAHARGRPTRVPGPHPRGPLALAVDLREDGWDLAVCELGGRATVVESRPHDGTPSGALLSLGAAVRREITARVVGVGVSVAGPVREGARLDISHLGWRDVEVATLLGLGATPLYVGNDARLAGLAEARRGRLHDVGVGLHLHIDFDLGGTLLVAGRPLAGASGTAGEFGHMPLTGDRGRPCQCGATGCWSLDVGSNALLRHVGLAAGGGRGRGTAERLLALAARARTGKVPAAVDAAAGRTDAVEAADAVAARAAVEAIKAVEAVEAVEANARALGAGIGALVNALDPEAVALSGIGVDLHALAAPTIERACADAVMSFRHGGRGGEDTDGGQDGHRTDGGHGASDGRGGHDGRGAAGGRGARIPPIAASSLGRQGPLTGAMEAVFDAFLTTEGVAAWRAAARTPAVPLRKGSA